MLCLFDFDGRNFASGVVRLADFVTNLQVFGIHPAFVLHIEGMLGRGLDLFAVYDDVGDDFVRAVDGVGDLVPAEGVG